jgi:hypothetical protein
MEATRGVVKALGQFSVAKKEVTDLLPEGYLFGFMQSYLRSGFVLESNILQTPLNCLIGDWGFGRKNKIDERRYQAKKANCNQKFHAYL